MRVFQTVVDEGGFAAAARLLELSPPVVTRLVADLEQHLGTRLLQRTTRKLALTEAGDAYLARVRAILHEIEDAEAAAAASTRDLRGTVRVVAPPVVATNFLAPMLSHWHAQQPLLMLDIDIDPYASARVDEFDVTFMVAAEGFDANIVARPLMQGESIVVASPCGRHCPKQPRPIRCRCRHCASKTRRASAGVATCSIQRATSGAWTRSSRSTRRSWSAPTAPSC